MTVATCAVFFLSGAAALTFESLWFRQAGLVLGNSVWTSALVTASFMAGLALGNAFAIRRGATLARPLRTFAALEAAVGATGVTLVLALPALGRVTAPVLSRLASGPALEAARLLGAFALLVVPAAAMGATLPVLARSLGARDPRFGRVLGRLYGWNTLGGVAGALAAETLLVPLLGIRLTAVAAASCDLLAAAGAWMLDRRQPPLEPAPAAGAVLPRRALRLAAAAFVAGGLLLALEVVWFRFLLLFLWATSATFAILLAVVLLGIAAGGLLGSVWLGRRPDAARHAAAVALLTGAAAVAGYALMEQGLPPRGAVPITDWGQTARATVWLTLPTCIASGLLFTLLGKALHGEAAEEARATGLLTLANTVGAMLGSLAAAFLLLPLLGMERSFFLLALGYAVAAALALARGPSWTVAAAGVAFAGALALFPFGAMRGRYVSRVEAAWGSRAAAVREGLTETVFLLRDDWLGQPRRYRLLTNAMAMSGTEFVARRYMGYFVWWPVAVHPAPRSALVISYGVGNTARTLAATRGIEHVDVVDVSADVLAMSPLVWPQPGDDPLRDPRVHANVEDGRFFLLTARRRYDLITGEPPPPKSAGIVSLYSREYFGLVRQRLAEGGVATYWLPVLHLRPREAFAIVRGFCDAFPDCSLWSGWGHEWMLVGTAGLAGPVPEERFTRQWQDPVAGPRLRAAGFDTPAQLGATFLADAGQLRVMAAGVPPLVDDRPYRVDARDPVAAGSPEYARIMDAAGARERFASSSFVRRLWPPRVLADTLPEFERQAFVNWLAWQYEGVADTPIDLAAQETAITRGGEAVALWTLETSVEDQQLARRMRDAGSQRPEVLEELGRGALARREYREADALLARAEPYAPYGARLRQLRILALGLLGDREGAARLLGGMEGSTVGGDRSAWAWLKDRFSLQSESD